MVKNATLIKQRFTIQHFDIDLALKFVVYLRKRRQVFVDCDAVVFLISSLKHYFVVVNNDIYSLKFVLL